jgi:uncharacterized membrane protein
MDAASTTSERGFNINLSARTISIAVLVFAIGVSGYLSYLKLSNEKAFCVAGETFDCGTVLNSVYSEVGGVPIAYLGLATNLIVISLLLLEDRISLLAANNVLLVFGIVLFAFLFSMYLIYVQAELIGSFCPWCLSHEAAISVLFALSSWRLYKFFTEPI